MFINNFDPVAIEIFSLEIRWYSLAYIVGILVGWYLAKKIFLVSDYLTLDQYAVFDQLQNHLPHAKRLDRLRHQHLLHLCGPRDTPLEYRANPQASRIGTNRGSLACCPKQLWPVLLFAAKLRTDYEATGCWQELADSPTTVQPPHSS